MYSQFSMPDKPGALVFWEYIAAFKVAIKQLGYLNVRE